MSERLLSLRVCVGRAAFAVQLILSLVCSMGVEVEIERVVRNAFCHLVFL